MKPSTLLFLCCAALLAYSAIAHRDPMGFLVSLLFGFGTAAAARRGR